jgi:SAM-dependent methyltransferase
LLPRAFIMTKIYDELSEWWPLMSAPAEYAEEAGFFSGLLKQTVRPPLKQVLELGSGGGNNASYLKKDFSMTLVDLSPGLLKVSEKLNPECEHLLGDMRSIRLGRQFDAVFVHDAVMYMCTADDLRGAMLTAFIHCRPGGAALFVPDCVRETFSPTTDHGGNDAAGRALRYLEWAYDPDPGDSQYIVDYVYAMRGEDGSVKIEYDRHINGIFPRESWLQLLREVGFHPQILKDNYDRELFLAAKPANAR